MTWYLYFTKFVYIVTEHHGSLAINKELPLSSSMPLPIRSFARRPSGTYDLFEYISSNVNPPESTIRVIFTQICEAVAYLHQNGIAHNDIKDENVNQTNKDSN
jgi:serine/threonine protein kinase